jgi:hypothetical protein
MIDTYCTSILESQLQYNSIASVEMYVGSLRKRATTTMAAEDLPFASCGILADLLTC